MQENLDKIQKFFKQDIETKELIYNLTPPIDYRYDESTIIKYSDSLYKALSIMKYNIISMMTNYKFGEENKKYVETIFNQYEDELIKCGGNFDKLSEFYTKYISEMNEELIDKVGNNCVGYTLFKGKHLIQESKTVNELLHVIHQNIVNDEEIYQSMPKLAEKKNNYDYEIVLYGNESQLGKEIYEKIPNDLDVGYTDIISLPNSNQVLMMVRDRGHALMINIDYSKEENLVQYFIPKICNEEMVRNLKGVRKGIIKNGYTTGSFQIDKNSTADELISFIEKVPTDNDIIINKKNYIEENSELNEMFEEKKTITTENYIQNK